MYVNSGSSPSSGQRSAQHNTIPTPPARVTLTTKENRRAHTCVDELLSITVAGGPQEHKWRVLKCNMLDSHGDEIPRAPGDTNAEALRVVLLVVGLCQVLPARREKVQQKKEEEEVKAISKRKKRKLVSWMRLKI